MSKKINLKLVMPKTATTEIELGLVDLTEKIAQLSPDLVSHGVLGGEFGYGAEYENDAS